MRITQQFLFQRSLSNLQRGLSTLGTVQEQASTGKKFQFASQDPIGFARVTQARDEKLRVDQYIENVGVSRSFLDTALAAVQDTSERFNSLRPSLLAVITGTASEEDRIALASDLKQFRSQLLSNANTRLQGNYLFGGTRTARAPFVQRADGSVEYRGDKSQTEVQIGPGVSTNLSLPGDSIFLALGQREVTFEGRTGLDVGSGVATGEGTALLQAVHTATFYGDEGLGGNGDSVSGVRPSASSVNGDTILGPAGAHRLTLTVAPDGLTGTVSLDGGPSVEFTSADADLEVTGPNGQKVRLDLTGVSAGFSGDVSIRTEGTISIEGGPAVALDYTQNQLYEDSTTGVRTYIDGTRVVAAGSEVITYSGTLDIFETIDRLITDLETNRGLSELEEGAVLRGRLKEFDNTAEAIREALTVMGSRSARLESTENQLIDVQINLEGLIGEFQDVDIAEVVGELSQLELVYQATLSVSARLLNLNPLGLLS